VLLVAQYYSCFASILLSTAAAMSMTTTDHPAEDTSSVDPPHAYGTGDWDESW
jgi:hypothetical protein